MSQNFRIALIYLLNRKRQSLISILGVMMGVGFFIAISALMQGFQYYFIDQVVNTSPHIVIKDEFRTPSVQPAQLQYPGAAIALRGQKPKDELRGIKNAEFIMDYLEDNEPQVNYAPTLQGQVFLRYGSKDVAATMLGIDPAKERLVTNIEKDMTGGSLTTLQTDSNGIILGDQLAEKISAKLNDKLSVISPAGVIVLMRVVGIFHTGIIAIDSTQSYALLRKAQVLQDKPNVINLIRMRLKDIERADPVAHAIEARFKYRTESWKEQNQNIFSIFVIQNAIMYSTVGAILLVAGFGIYNIISTVVYEKKRDIAILKSMGFFEGDIRRIYVFQGFMVGIVGTICGWMLGFGLVQMMSRVDIVTEGIVKMQGLVMHHTIYQYIISSILAIIASIFSAWLPASKAAKVNPVDIIRGAT